MWFVRRLIRLVVIAWLVLFYLVQSSANAQSKPTLDEIIAAWEQTEKLLFESDSFLLTYERTQSKDIIPSLMSGGLLNAKWTIANRGSQWYVERSFTNPKTSPEPKPTIYIVRKGFILEWTDYNHRAVIDHFGLGRNIYNGLDYFRNSFLDAPKYIARTVGAEERIDEIRKQWRLYTAYPYLPGFLRENKSRYRILPETEEIEGVTCWVVEWPGMDRMWIDPMRGFSIPRREYHWGPDLPLKYDIRNRDLKEVKSGLWLPTKQIEYRYADIEAENKSIWGKITCQSEYVLNSIAFDTLTDAFFEKALPDGTFVYDVTRDMQYNVSDRDTSDPFTMPIAEGQQLLRQPTNWFFIANICVVIVLIVMLCFRVWNKRYA